MKKIKLAIIQPIMSPYRRPLWELVSHYQEVEFKVFVISKTYTHRPDWRVRENEKFDVEVVHKFLLAKSVAAFQPDVVICASASEFILLYPLKLFCSCYIGGWIEDTFHTVSQLHRKNHWLRAWIYRRMDFYIVNGIETTKYLNSIGVNNRITHGKCSIDNSIYTKTKHGSNSTINAKSRWISVGRLYRSKGFEELINAWSMQDINFMVFNELIIVGTGPDKDQLNTQIKELNITNAKVIEYQSPDQLATEYAQSDIFIFPTHRDIWGLVVNEAMAAELPIVCSKYAGCYADLVTPSNGVIIDPHDIKSFANEIYKIWKKRGQWKQMGKESKNIISAYTLDATANAIIIAATSMSRSH